MAMGLLLLLLKDYKRATLGSPSIAIPVIACSVLEARSIRQETSNIKSSG